ncbi:MAG: sugar phosphate isomerase/epimerase [Chthoniobacterales bacterium]
MKYAFNTWAYSSFPTWLPSYPLDEAIRRIAAIGYDGVEIGCAAPHAWPAYLNKERRAELRNLMETCGLQTVSLLATPGGGPGFNPASPLAEEREATVRYYNEVIDLALDLGAEKVPYIAGWQIFGTTRQQAWDRSKDCLDQIASHANNKGITIVVEPTAAATNLIETADDALELMRSVGRDNVKVMFDTLHALYRNEIPADYVRAMREDLVHVHVSDSNRVIPGEGRVDWVGLMQALNEHAYSGYLTMEIGLDSRAADPDQIARTALRFLKGVESQLNCDRGR